MCLTLLSMRFDTASKSITDNGAQKAKHSGPNSMDQVPNELKSSHTRMAEAASSAGHEPRRTRDSDLQISKKGQPFRGNHSLIDTVIFGTNDLDDSPNADKRDFTNAAGVRTSSPLAEPTHSLPRHTVKETNQAFALMFGREWVDSSKAEDTRDFEGAAGNRSYTAELQGIFAPKVSSPCPKN